MAEKKKRGNGLNKVFLNFQGTENISLTDLYGTTDIPITELTKRLWVLINEKNLRVKKS